MRLCPVGPGSRRVSVGSAEPQETPTDTRRAAPGPRCSRPAPLGNEEDGAGLALRKTTGCRGGEPLTARTSTRPTRKMLSQTYQKRRWAGWGWGIKEGVPEVELNADVKRQGAHGGAALSGGPG